MKRKNRSGHAPIIALAIIVISILVLSISSPLFSVVVLDDQKQQYHAQSVDTSIATGLSQSVFGPSGILTPYFMQSTVPITEESIAIFRAVITNPFDERAKLLSATTYKNEQLIHTKEYIDFYLNGGAEHIFKSEEIDLEGESAKQNTLKIEFLFERNGEQKTQIFEYNYLSLTRCITNSDCQNPTNHCDIGNVARFSDKSDEFFCVQPCVSNTACSEGQVCIRGYCGY